MEYVCRKIEGWIRSKVREAGAKGVVLGMSGGVDSSVVAVLADRALGKKSLALILPCESDKKDRERAKLVAKRSGIKTKEIDLTGVFNSLKKLLPEADRKTLGNLKSRLRMLALYHFANKYSYLVLGTSNKSELKIGYVTKYGDSAVDLEPIGDLYKTQVVELAKHLQIHEEILKSEPTAGLWKGQTDLGEIGIDYGKLDTVLETMDSRLKPERIDPRIMGKVKKMIRKSEHKRRTPEICELS